jgi:hypothetical protein
LREHELRARSVPWRSTARSSGLRSSSVKAHIAAWKMKHIASLRVPQVGALAVQQEPQAQVVHPRVVR